MHSQLVWMSLLCIICWASAVDWAMRGAYASAVAFVLYGLADLALAWAIRGGIGDVP